MPHSAIREILVPVHGAAGVDNTVGGVIPLPTEEMKQCRQWHVANVQRKDGSEPGDQAEMR